MILGYMKHPETLFVIIDGHAIIHRAYHALPPMTTKDGTVVHAVYGFASMLMKVIETLHPTHIAVAFDVAGGTFRDEVFADYKGTRKPADDDLYAQIPLVYELVEAFGIPIYTQEGYEADDVIGTVVKSLGKKKIKSVVVTGDKDLLQLVDECIGVYLLKKGMSEGLTYTPALVQEQFGFLPEFIPDWKALRGDPSDNIPGIAGIGEKTATTLIQALGSLDDIYRILEKDSSKLLDVVRAGVIQKLQTGEKTARMSYTLATICTTVPDLNFDMDTCVLGETLPVEKIKTLFQKFEFFSLIKRLGPQRASLEEKTSGSVSVVKQKKIQPPGQVTEKNKKEFFKKLQQSDVIFIREVVEGDDMNPTALAGFLFFLESQAFFLTQGSVHQEKDTLVSIFSDTKKIVVGHDLKQCLKALLLYTIDVHAQLFDVMIASYVLNSSSRAHDLFSIVERELGKTLSPVSVQKTLLGVSPDAFLEGLVCCESLYDVYKKRLTEDENLGLFTSMEMPLIPVLTQMEVNGIFVDIPELEKLSSRVTKDIAKREKNIWKQAGKEFNVASSVQLRDILFDTMQLPTQGIKKGKTGYSTAASELEKLRDIDPIILDIEQFRELEKLRNTYIDVLPTLVNPDTKRIHTHFNQTVAATGRLSSTNPNLQNIPIRTELGRDIRRTFIAAPGYTLIAADYSQIELRIVASLAQDKNMLAIFERGEDIHTATAAAIHGVPLQDVTKDMRRSAKEVNFGILYGMGAYGLAWRAGILQADAKRFIDAYFETFSGVKKYLEETVTIAKKTGYVETLFGRKRHIPELTSPNFQLRQAAERMAINMPVQGTAADIMKLAMIAVDTTLDAYALTDARLLLQVHDELVLEVKPELAQEIADKVQSDMQSVSALRVPIDVSVSIGTCWGDMK